MMEEEGELDVHIVDYETGKSVALNVNETEIIRTLLERAKQFWQKEGDFELFYGERWLLPTYCLKDYDIQSQDIIKLQKGSYLERHKSRHPELHQEMRPEGVVFPEECPGCGKVKFRYISPTEFQCQVCGGVIVKEVAHTKDVLDGTYKEAKRQTDPTSAGIEVSSHRLPRIVVRENDPERVPESVPGSVPGTFSTVNQVWQENGTEGDEGCSSQIPSVKSEKIVPEVKGRAEENIPIPTLMPVVDASQGQLCDSCYNSLRYIDVYDAWWCDVCEKYLGEDDSVVFTSDEFTMETSPEISGRPSQGEIFQPDATVQDPESDDLLEQGKEWLIKYMDMKHPFPEKIQRVEDKLEVEFHDRDGKFCILEIFPEGGGIIPLYYSSKPGSIPEIKE